MRLAIFLLIVTTSFAADTGVDLLAAAKRGQTSKVDALLAKGSPVEATDKDGRTPLMLAAEKGHADTVAALLKHGAKVEARDRQGWTAYGLAVFSSANGREAVLKALPAHPPLRLMLESKWVPDNLITSCFLLPAQLRDQVAALQLDAHLAALVRDYGMLHGRRLIEFVAEGGDATLHLTVRPGDGCLQQQSADDLTLLVDEKVTEGTSETALVEKTYGKGKLEMSHIWRATSPAQYEKAYDDLAKAYVSQIYWSALEAWLRHR